MRILNGFFPTYGDSTARKEYLSRTETMSEVRKVSISSYLTTITRQSELAFPKDRNTREEVIESFHGLGGETKDAWLVSCRHTLHPPASPQEIEQVESQLGYPLPEELRLLLSLTNGVALYIVPHWISKIKPDPGFPWYELFDTAKLVEVNRELRGVFQHTFCHDPELRELQLNYVAFCDAHNGNFLAIIREGSHQGQIFFLDHDLAFRPYSERDNDFYFVIAKSLEDWLERLMKTRGANGFEKQEPEA